jgi:hypothetical protein
MPKLLNCQSPFTPPLGDQVMANEDLVITLDLESAWRNFDGDASLIRDIGQIFIDDTPALVDQLLAL